MSCAAIPNSRPRGSGPARRSPGRRRRGGDAALRFADSLLPLLAGGTVLIFAACLAAMGIKRFYGQPVSWRATAAITGLSFAGIAVLHRRLRQHADADPGLFAGPVGAAGADAEAAAVAAGRPRKSRRPARGHRRRSSSSASMPCRVAGTLLHLGGDFSVVQSNPVQSVLMLMLMFLSMAWNFGFLLMAIDRLRNEVADLALLDDLTGVGNRRHLLQRLTEECARSERSGEPFALLVIDLDGFKAINDTHGHAAGDACLQHFTLMAQTRLRPGDMLARTGGDEFCVVLPASTLREGAMIARRIIEVCREDAEAMRRRRYPDRGLDRRRAMDPGDGRVPGPADRRRRPCALRRQERRQEPPRGLRPRAAAGARV